MAGRPPHAAAGPVVPAQSFWHTPISASSDGARRGRAPCRGAPLRRQRVVGLEPGRAEAQRATASRVDENFSRTPSSFRAEEIDDAVQEPKPSNQRLWRRFRQIEKLPVRERRQLLAIVDAILERPELVMRQAS